MGHEPSGRAARGPEHLNHHPLLGHLVLVGFNSRVNDLLSYHFTSQEAVCHANFNQLGLVGWTSDDPELLTRPGTTRGHTHIKNRAGILGSGMMTSNKSLNPMRLKDLAWVFFTIEKLENHSMLSQWQPKFYNITACKSLDAAHRCSYPFNDCDTDPTWM